MRILLGLFLLVFLSGCVAKNAEKITYYELNYQNNKVCAKNEKIPVFLEYVRSIESLDSRNIFIKDGNEITAINNAKFIAYPRIMLYKSLSEFLVKSCDFEQVLDKQNAQIVLQIKLLDLSITKSLAELSAIVLVKDDNLILDKQINVAENIVNFNQENALKALNNANMKLINKIEYLLKQ